MSRLKGKPAMITAKIPPWLAESLALDIENVITFIQSAPRDRQPLFPLHLHDFAEELRKALKEAREDAR